MKNVNRLLKIKTKPDPAFQDVALELELVEYITHRKDGRYYQPFSLEDTLVPPVVLTGDCLARTENKDLEEGEYAFKVYDKIGDAYELNPNKQLFVELVYDEDSGENILTRTYYIVTVSNEEFKNLEAEKRRKDSKKGKKK